MAFICGSFRSQEEDDIDAICPISSSSPRKPTRRRNIIGSRRSKNTTNPYSDRGLDKFEALMADLDQQRQKIMIQKGSEDVSMIKFIYRNSNEVKPIVVKIKDQRKRDSASSIESTLQLEQEEDVAFAKGVNIRNIEQGKMVKPLVHESKNNKIITGQWRKNRGMVESFVLFPFVPDHDIGVIDVFWSIIRDIMHFYWLVYGSNH